MALVRREEAEALARAQLRENETLLEASTITLDIGWVFFYQSTAYVESGDELEALVGNEPIFIDCRDASVHALHTSDLGWEPGIERYRRTGQTLPPELALARRLMGRTIVDLWLEDVDDVEDGLAILALDDDSRLEIRTSSLWDVLFRRDDEPGQP